MVKNQDNIEPLTVWHSPNELLKRVLDEQIIRDKVSNKITVFSLIQIDSFKLLEQRYPLNFTNKIIHLVKNRLQGSLCKGSRLQNIGGGRIALAYSCSPLLTSYDFKRFFEHVQSVVAQEISIGHTKLNLTSSIGYVDTPVPKTEALIESATIALMEALNLKTSSIIAFTQSLTDIARKKLNMSSALVSALNDGEISAVFQPQVNSQTNEVIGFEALARWNSKEDGSIPPSQFLPYFEDAGMMANLGVVILRHALTALSSWDEQGLKIATVSVNMSMSELENPHLVDTVTFELERLGLDPKRLVVEILESVVMGVGPCQIAENIKSLQKLGCAIDLDDFGTGQASISAIRRFCVDRIKIDRTFISNIDQDVEQQDMVVAILMVAKRLNVDILAEGVECEGELEFLNTAGCSCAQGYFISHPLNESDVPAWLAKHDGENNTLVSQKRA